MPAPTAPAYTAASRSRHAGWRHCPTPHCASSARRRSSRVPSAECSHAPKHSRAPKRRAMSSAPARRRSDLLMVAAGVTLIILDQLTKHWIVDYFAADPTRPPIALVDHILDLEYLQNTGVAFSMFAGQT